MKHELSVYVTGWSRYATQEKVHKEAVAEGQGQAQQDAKQSAVAPRLSPKTTPGATEFRSTGNAPRLPPYAPEATAPTMVQPISQPYRPHPKPERHDAHSTMSTHLFHRARREVLRRNQLDALKLAALLPLDQRGHLRVHVRQRTVAGKAGKALGVVAIGIALGHDGKTAANDGRENGQAR